MGKPRELTPAELYHHCDPGQFNFETTAQLTGITEAVGQPRAVEAMEFGIDIEQKGYNIFAVGPAGMGKRSFIGQFFEQKAAGEAVPDDWCYVNNFQQPHRPQSIRLPAGKGVELQRDMERLVQELQTTLSVAFESEEYQNRRQAVAEELQEQQTQIFEQIQKEAQERQLAVLRTPAGLAVAPVRDGEVLSPEQIQNLSEEERHNLEEEVEFLQERIQKIVRQMTSLQREVQQKLRELDREVADYAVGSLIDELGEKYGDSEKVVEFLHTVQKDVVENAKGFLPSEEKEGDLLGILRRAASEAGPGGSPLARRYQVNVLVDNSQARGAPVVFEDNPTYQNLIGRVEHLSQMGALLTDFTLVKPGALHRANGGYLIVDARKLLTQPYAWEGLKRALRSGVLSIESVGQMLSLVSTVSLEPEPIPLDVKVALYGDRMLYYLLWQLDPDFAELFKVEVDFAEDMERNGENQLLYAQLIATTARREQLLPLDREGVARVIEHSSRVTGDSEKLSTQMRDITDLLHEAHYWTKNRGGDLISAADVQKAIDAQIYRADRARERAQEAILRDIVLIDTKGEQTGQVNGLSVLQLGNFGFGRPSRITAQVRVGKGQVVDIEREVQLGGPIHSKGVLILASFLGARYAQERPLSLSASLVFEQSYSGVEGDSASSAELYALLSAISQVPVKQSLAVTGSVNQHGQVQAIGGVNEKIEGFYDICRARGLTAGQGVLIPTANVKHLMLRRDVVEAVAAGQFHIYPVETIDQGIEILTGLPAGERDEHGHYPQGSVNLMVEKRLADMAERLQAFASSKEGNE